jgi:hypothetical protein
VTRRAIFGRAIFRDIKRQLSYTPDESWRVFPPSNGP